MNAAEHLARVRDEQGLPGAASAAVAEDLSPRGRQRADADGAEAEAATPAAIALAQCHRRYMLKSIQATMPPPMTSSMTMGTRMETTVIQPARFIAVWNCCSWNCWNPGFIGAPKP